MDGEGVNGTAVVKPQIKSNSSVQNGPNSSVPEPPSLPKDAGPSLAE